MSEEIVAPPAFDSNRLVVPDFITPYSSVGNVVAREVSPVSAYMDVTSNELVFKDAANFGRYIIEAAGVASPIPEEFIATINFSFGDSTSFPYFAMSSTVGNSGGNSLGVAFSTHAGILGGVGANELILFFDGITLASTPFIPPRTGDLSLELKNGQITASVNGSTILSVSDSFPAIDPSPLSYFFSYWPFAYFTFGAQGSSTSNVLNTSPVSGTITGATLFFPSLVGVRLISANQNGEGLPPGPGIGRPTVTFEPMIALAGNIPSQEAFGGLTDLVWGTVPAPSSGTTLNHYEGTFEGSGTILPASVGDLVASPVKFGTGAAESATIGSFADMPGIVGDFSLDAWVYTPSGIDYTYFSFGDFYDLAFFSDAGDVLGDYDPVVISGPSIFFSSYDTTPISIVGPVTGLPLNSYNHVEVSRTSGVWYLFLNGVLLGTGADTSSSIPRGVRFNGIPSSGVAVDELRVQFGTGGHTSNFTPPTAPY